MNVIILKREVSFGVGRGERGKLKLLDFLILSNHLSHPLLLFFLILSASSNYFSYCTKA